MNRSKFTNKNKNEAITIMMKLKGISDLLIGTLDIESLEDQM